MDKRYTRYSTMWTDHERYARNKGESNQLKTNKIAHKIVITSKLNVILAAQ
jgi:hypothetical protein